LKVEEEEQRAVLWSAQRVWGCLTDWVMERVGRADGGIPTIKGHSKIFIGGHKDYFQEFEFFWGRIAVPAVLDNRASRLLEFRHGDAVSGETERDAPGTVWSRRIAVPAVLDNRASRLLGFRHGDEVSGETERDAPGTDWSRMLQLRCDCRIPG
jgi:hypothetical protein